MGLSVTQGSHLINCRISNSLSKNPLCIVSRPRKDVVIYRDFNSAKNVGEERGTF